MDGFDKRLGREGVDDAFYINFVDLILDLGKRVKKEL
jgi:hypothetical protein